jgi:hypothetical protein
MYIMTQTIEDALEILGGTRLRVVNIRIDMGEVNLVRSLAKQVSRGTALTDRQMELAIKKIEKYRKGLEQNFIRVDDLLTEKTLRMPLREIDRTQLISLVVDSNKKLRILIKFVFSKKFAGLWNALQDELNVAVEEKKNEKQLSFNEQDFYKIVNALQPMGFMLSPNAQLYYEKIDEISENPENHVPYIDLVDNRLVLKNVNSRCQTYLDEQFTDLKDSDFLVFLDRLKNCGIFHKNPKIIEKISEFTSNNLVKNILVSDETRFRINPQEHTHTSVFDILDQLKQWPVLIVVDENKDAISMTKSLCSELMSRLAPDEVTVFFRLENGNPEHEEFNQFVRDNHLNNYIDSKTKAVFVSKNRIPKPLFTADWHPKTALVTATHEFGKTSAYLNDFPTVYYYNNSVFVRHGRIKGTRSIVQL